jgi:hypothetical protein
MMRELKAECRGSLAANISQHIAMIAKAIGPDGIASIGPYL